MCKWYIHVDDGKSDFPCWRCKQEFTSTAFLLLKSQFVKNQYHTFIWKFSLAANSITFDEAFIRIVWRSRFCFLSTWLPVNSRHRIYIWNVFICFNRNPFDVSGSGCEKCESPIHTIQRKQTHLLGYITGLKLYIILLQ